MKSSRRDFCEDHLHPGTPLGYLPTQNVYTSHRDKVQLQSTQIEMHFLCSIQSHSTASPFSCHRYCQNLLLPPMPCCLSQPPASLFPVQQHLSLPSPALQEQLFYPWAAACYDGVRHFKNEGQPYLLWKEIAGSGCCTPTAGSCFNGGKTCNRRTLGEELKNKQPLPNISSGEDLQTSQEEFLKAAVGLCYYGFHTLPI